MYDIVIIGAGPAGLTAAIYALRAEKKILIIEKETFGGQMTHSPKIENYPGFMQMSGNELADRMLEQVLEHGGELEMDTVTGIRVMGDRRVVVTENGEFDAKTVIIATGSKHRQLGLPNENEFVGTGISYCAVCDGAFYKDRNVAVIGGGNSALQDAVMLSDICKKVTIVQNLPYLTGEERLQNFLASKSNVEIITNKTVATLIGEESLTSINIKDETSGVITNLKVDGIFVAIGQKPENEPFASVTRLNEYGYIDSDEACLTDDPAVFVAGDCRSKRIRQITTATADGAVAALAACRYIDK